MPGLCFIRSLPPDAGAGGQGGSQTVLALTLATALTGQRSSRPANSLKAQSPSDPAPGRFGGYPGNLFLMKNSHFPAWDSHSLLSNFFICRGSVVTIRRVPLTRR